MKVTSLKEVENYLYVSVIVPLKELQISMEVQTPISRNGNNWYFEVGRTTPTENFRRNYQRDRANENRDWLIYLIADNNSHIVGRYIPKGRFVELYKKPFRDLRATMLLGRLHFMFDTHEPFTKIRIKELAPIEPQPRVREVPYEEEYFDNGEDYDDV